MAPREGGKRVWRVTLTPCDQSVATSLPAAEPAPKEPQQQPLNVATKLRNEAARLREEAKRLRASAATGQAFADGSLDQSTAAAVNALKAGQEAANFLKLILELPTAEQAPLRAIYDQMVSRLHGHAQAISMPGTPVSPSAHIARELDLR